MHTMRLMSWTLLVLISFTTVAHAQHSPKQIAEDALRHRSLAEAQQLIAKCLVSGKGSELCLAEAKGICAGLAIGKHCGLKESAISNLIGALQATSKAHTVAAQCLESGKPYEDCIWDLQTACRGLAIGKYCGLVHSHSF
jgi:hypothetical protein